MSIDVLSVPRDLATLRASFPGAHLDLALASILDGNTEGELWRVGREEAAWLLLWDRGNNVLFWSGQEDERAATEAAQLVEEEIAPRSIAAGRSYFKTQAVGPASDGFLARAFPGVVLTPSTTLLYVDSGAPLSQIVAPDIPDLVFLPITGELLPADLAGMAEVREEVDAMWPSRARFDERGLGVVAVVGQRVVCWCTAEYMSADRCGIGIATEPELRGRGIAPAATRWFLERARTAGLRVHWECRAGNAASMRVAGKVGLVKLSGYTQWIGRFSVS